MRQRAAVLLSDAEAGHFPPVCVLTSPSRGLLQPGSWYAYQSPVHPRGDEDEQPEDEEEGQRPTIDLMQSDLTAGWIIGAATRPLVDFQRSTEQYRSIAVGEEDFNGYE